MNKDIIILSSSTDFTQKFSKLLENRKLDYPIFECTGSKTVEIARQFINEGTKIIITRGKNLELLRENINAILIDVRYTYEDMYFSLKADSTILITWSSGSGKKIFAQSIHNFSDRLDEPFVAINCAALPKSILESELFGYVKGAFTGARPEGKAGIFELAHNGTVFLDEVGETSQDIQVRLLRVIQEKEIIRIGDDKVIPVNVRIISATNKNLLERIERNRFREDLYYRLCVLELKLPSLDERKKDIPLLVKHFISSNAPDIRITSDALLTLGSLPYKGNIRHLHNIVERLIVMCENNIIDDYLVSQVLDLEPNNSEKSFLQPFSEEPSDATSEISKIENQLIKDTLKKYNGNKTKVAKELGMSYTTLWRRLKKM
jgi:Transcriptional regulator containing PAS, AAA-type ATPase, and DNA-binding domains